MRIKLPAAIAGQLIDAMLSGDRGKLEEIFRWRRSWRERPLQTWLAEELQAEESRRGGRQLKPDDFWWHLGSRHMNGFGDGLVKQITETEIVYYGTRYAAVLKYPRARMNPKTMRKLRKRPIR